MDHGPIAEVTVGSADGFADLCLRLSDLRRDSDGVHRFVARGAHLGRKVGFAVSLSSMWERQDLEDSSLTLYWGRADLMSIGSESDAFVQALDEIYNTQTGHQKMHELVPYLAVSLEGYPPHIEHESVKLKLFFESENEEGAAEFYLNVDPQKSTVEFHEKDTDYRRGVVLSLSAGVA